jgi:hypothetical protein
LGKEDTVNLRHNEVIVNHDFKTLPKEVHSSGRAVATKYVLGVKISRSIPQKCGVWCEIRYGEVRYGAGLLYLQFMSVG